MVYFRENRKDKIRGHSWPNPKVSVHVQSASLYIFSTLYKVFREFHRHFKSLQPLEFDFWAKIPNRPVRNPFFSA